MAEPDQEGSKKTVRQLRPGKTAGHTEQVTGGAEPLIPAGLFGSERLGKLPGWAGIVALLALGILLHFPSLESDLILDDVLHRSMVDGEFPGDRGALDLYTFVDDSNRDELRERGLLPWWTHPDLTLRFFRPLSSALIWADHRLLGGSTPGMHVHSLVWWMVAVLALRALYRTYFSPRVAWIGALIFALAPCHAMPLSWIANRDVLLSLAFGALALVAHVRWREHHRPIHALLGTLGFTLSLLAGEYGISMLAYVVAFELVRKDDRFLSRVVGLLPCAVPVALYLGFRSSMHYGTDGSGYYADPFDDPAVFAWFAPRRLDILLLDAWLGLGPERIGWDIPTWVLSLVVAFVAWLVLVALRESFATLDLRAQRATTSFAIGSVLALVPVLAVVPTPRLLGACMIGLSPTVAVILDGFWFRAAAPPSPAKGTEPAAPAKSRRLELATTIALALAFCQLVRGPMESFTQGRHHRNTSYHFAAQARSFAALRLEAGDAEPLVVRALGAAFFIPFALGTGHLPARHRVLAETRHALVIREGDHTLDLFAPREGSLFPVGEANLFRDLRSPLVEGDVVQAPGMTVTITDVVEGRVIAARYELDRSLDEVAFFSELRAGYERADTPPIGFGVPLDAGDSLD